MLSRKARRFEGERAFVRERERSAEILSRAKDLESAIWRARRDSNLRRFAGVSEAGARSRNPEP